MVGRVAHHPGGAVVVGAPGVQVGKVFLERGVVVKTCRRDERCGPVGQRGEGEKCEQVHGE